MPCRKTSHAQGTLAGLCSSVSLPGAARLISTCLHMKHTDRGVAAQSQGLLTQSPSRKQAMCLLLRNTRPGTGTGMRRCKN